MCNINQHVQNSNSPPSFTKICKLALMCSLDVMPTNHPLQPTYDGPFRVIDRKDKYFVVALSDSRQDTISINRLKPAYCIHTPETIAGHSNSDSPEHLSQQPPCHAHSTQSSPSVFRTRSGRKVQWPDRLIQTL